MKRVLLQKAYVLHRRAYRETSFLVDLLTREQGRLTVIARGARSSKRSSGLGGAAGLLQPFMPLIVSWAGRSELMTLTHAEADGASHRLKGECLFAGLYLNELLMQLLHKWDPHAALYDAYAKAVSALALGQLEQGILRSFEKYLLEELGYGLLPQSEQAFHQTFSARRCYRFIPERGLVVCEVNETGDNIFSGNELLAIVKEDWQNAATLQSAKRLTRYALSFLLGQRPIHSRRLFIQSEEEKHA